MDQKLTILFTPCNYVGPINACIGIAQVLKDSGHRIIFAVSSEWKERLKGFGFEEELIGDGLVSESEGSAKRNAEEVQEMFGNKSVLEKAICDYKLILTTIFEDMKRSDQFIDEIIIRTKPNVIFVDHVLRIPSVVNSGIPWVWSLSSNPLCLEWGLDCPTVPPAFSGLPTNKDYQNLWQEFRKELKNKLSDDWKQYNEFLISKNCGSLEEFKFIEPSPHLNIYMFPKELDYTDVRPLAETFVQFDCFKRRSNEVNEEFEIPEMLRTNDSKLIYFSLGSMGAADCDLMRRLIAILANSHHKFIVSTGPSGDQIKLALNMWGKKTLPQIKVLPIADAVITHGGNNTLTETVYFGKPMIVLPLFSDQFDNAFRVEEKGFGFKLDPYLCTETELLSAIDRLFTDEDIGQRVRSTAQRIQRENKILKLPEIIEKLAQSLKNF